VSSSNYAIIYGSVADPVPVMDILELRYNTGTTPCSILALIY